VGGYLTALAGHALFIHVTDAHDQTSESAPELMSPMLPRITVMISMRHANRLSQGKKLLLDGYPDSKEPIAAIGPGDRLVGLITVKKNQSRVVVNFPADTEGSALS
jgi:tRNA pseudouridine55 synthase